MGWCQGCMARDAKGYVTVDINNAVAYCIYGALRKCYSVADTVLVFCKLCEYLQTNPMQWNDMPGRTKEEVIAALEAIGE